MLGVPQLVQGTGAKGLCAPGSPRGERAEPRAGREQGAPGGGRRGRPCGKQALGRRSPRAGGAPLYLLLAPAHHLPSGQGLSLAWPGPGSEPLPVAQSSVRACAAPVALVIFD